MKNSKIIVLLAMVILSIVSCTKENIELPTEIDPILLPEPIETSNNPLVAQVLSDEDFDLGCFNINTPFDLTVDGVISTITSVEDFDAALINATEGTEIDFIYPLTITYEDGEIAEIADGMALGEAFAVCIPDGGWNVSEGGFPAYVINAENSCYDLLYPLTLNDLDENSITVEDEAAFIEALANNNILFFNFPLILIDENEEEVTAENDDELFGLFFECEGTHPPCDSIPYTSGGLGCYELGFPLGVIQIDANGNETTVILETEDDLNNNLLNGNIVGFAFPLTLIDEEGNALVINNQEELDLAFFECGGFGEPTEPGALLLLTGDINGGGTCYDIQYPVSYVGPNSNITETANNFDEFFNAVFSNTGGFIIELIYPVEVVLAEDNSTVTINSTEELFTLLEACQ